MSLKDLQKEVVANKKRHHFNVTDMNEEFCHLYGEVAEAFEAYRKKRSDLGEELADVAIYLLGLSEILGIELQDEIEKKMKKNEKRVYKKIDGVTTRISD